MRLTTSGHACVRIEDGDRILVIDPGTLSDRDALAGATAVLITHEHDDHLDTDLLATVPGLTVYAPPGLAAEIGATTVHAGDVFTAAGFTVRAVGGDHAGIVDGLPGCPHLGYLVDGVYHPGDSYTVPDADVHTLLVPVSGPWASLPAAIAFVRAVAPARSYPIHDAHLSDIGIETADWWLATRGGTVHTRIPRGEPVTLTTSGRA